MTLFEQISSKLKILSTHQVQNSFSSNSYTLHSCDFDSLLNQFIFDKEITSRQILIETFIYTDGTIKNMYVDDYVSYRIYPNGIQHISFEILYDNKHYQILFYCDKSNNCEKYIQSLLIEGIKDCSNNVDPINLDPINLEDLDEKCIFYNKIQPNYLF